MHKSPQSRVKVVFHFPDGNSKEVYGSLGESVMDVALDNGVPGIEAQCGGGCTCSTCHCYVNSPWFAKSGPMHPDEVDILGFTPCVRANSRLACQIQLRKTLDGLSVSTIDTNHLD